MSDKVVQSVIDEYRRDSFLLDQLTFDDTISPGTGGSTLTYGYTKLESPSTVATRKINEEYTPGVAKRKKMTTDAIIFGGSYEIDRVIANTSGAVNEVAFQQEEKIKAGANYFHYIVINGSGEETDTGYVAGTFDGLRKLISGSDTEITSTLDISTSALVDENYNALLDELDTFLSYLDGKPTLLMMNTTMLTKVKSCARRAGYLSQTEDAFGRTVENYNGIPMIDAGQYYDGTKTVDVVATDDVDGTSAIYAVILGLNGFHGISVGYEEMFNTILPDFSTAGAVKKGEVEMIAGVALKNSRKAGVLKGIKIK